MSDESKANEGQDLGRTEPEIIRIPDMVIECPKAPDKEVARREPKITDLTQQQQQYIALLNQGRNDQESAELLGADPKTLYRWRQNPVFVYFWNESRKTLTEKMAGLRPRALEKLGKLIDSEDERVSMAACMALLKTELEVRRGGNKDEVEDIVAELEKDSNANERLEIARKIRAQLDAESTAGATEQEGKA